MSDPQKPTSSSTRNRKKAKLRETVGSAVIFSDSSSSDSDNSPKRRAANTGERLSQIIQFTEDFSPHSHVNTLFSDSSSVSDDDSTSEQNSPVAATEVDIDRTCLKHQYL